MIKYFWIIAFLGLISCGPMNGTPPETSNTPHAPSLGGNTLSRSSKENHFLISVTIPQSQAGDNTAVIRIAHADLRHLSPEASVTLAYWMPEMPEMGQETLTPIPQGDGTTFEASLFFSMSGTWEISLTIKDQGIEDTYVFTTLAQ